MCPGLCKLAEDILLLNSYLLNQYSFGANSQRKRVTAWQPFSNMLKKQKMELPYDFSLSHHQLLFNIITLNYYATNMEIVFPKSKQNDKFTEREYGVT